MTTMTRTNRKEPWAAALTAVLAVLALVFGVLAVAAPATADSGNGADKITICHFVPGNGETKDHYNVITIAMQAWLNGHSDGDDPVYNHNDRDVVYDGGCPTIEEPEYCPEDATANAGMEIPAGETAETYCVAREDKVEICHLEGNGTFNLIEVDDSAVQAHLDHGDVYPDEFGACPAPVEPQYCAEDATANAGLPIPEGYTEETYCVAGGSNDEPGTGGGGGGGTTPVVDACPNLEGVQWEGYDCNTGLAAPVEAATVPEEPAPVTAVEAATVTAPKPAKAVLPATVPAGVALPASVPAGGGSSVPSTPAYALALLALGAMTLAASTVRLVKAPTR